jgi:6-pyruvoyltetrahydropterin/6-carboxytetrahydropterin synthase
MVFLTRRTGFSAAHRYYLPDLSDSENDALYGPCANPHGHGHDYTVDVTVRGETDPRTGMVVNIAALKPILQAVVVEPLDREFLSIRHPVCRGKVPTSENLVRVLWDGLEHALAAAHVPAALHRVHLAENAVLSVDCCRRDSVPMVLLTRTYEFCAAHRLHSPHLSDEENQALFDKCNNPYGHGHNYRVEVTVQGDVDPRTGLMVNLNDLDRIVDEEVVRRYDHRNLNAEAEEFRELNPSSENLVKVIWRRLERRLLSPTLYKVCVRETDRNVFSYYGEGE